LQKRQFPTPSAPWFKTFQSNGYVQGYGTTSPWPRRIAPNDPTTQDSPHGADTWSADVPHRRAFRWDPVIVHPNELELVVRKQRPPLLRRTERYPGSCSSTFMLIQELLQTIQQGRQWLRELSSRRRRRFRQLTNATLQSSQYCRIIFRPSIPLDRVAAVWISAIEKCAYDDSTK